MLEFMFLAQTRINSCKELARGADENVRMVQHETKKVWEAKLEQTIEKAKFVLGDDPDFVRVQNKYQTQKYKDDHRCQYCGGKFKGMFHLVCSKCGKPKDY